MKCPVCGSTEDLVLRLDGKNGKDYSLNVQCEACSHGGDYYIQCESGSIDELIEEPDYEYWPDEV